MADQLSLQPIINIRLHIVADDEKRENVFREIERLVVSLVGNGALAQSCSYLSYANVQAIARIPYLAHMTYTTTHDYEEVVE